MDLSGARCSDPLLCPRGLNEGQDQTWLPDENVLFWPEGFARHFFAIAFLDLKSRLIMDVATIERHSELVLAE